MKRLAAIGIGAAALALTLVWLLLPDGATFDEAGLDITPTVGPRPTVPRPLPEAAPGAALPGAPAAAPARLSPEDTDAVHAATRAAGVQRPTAAITGRVVHSDGSPAPGLGVRVWEMFDIGVIAVATGSYRDAVTGEDGRFHIKHIAAAGDWDVRLQRDTAPAGLVAEPVSGVVVRPGESTDVGELVLQPSGSMEGWVLGPDRRPIQAARVSTQPADVPRLDVERVQQTDADGHFVFDGLLPVRARLVVIADGYISRAEELPLAPGEITRHEVELQSELTLSGTVRGADGSVPTDAAVTAVPHATDDVPPPPAQADVDPDTGAFSLRGLRHGPYRVSARATGYGKATSPEVPVPGDELHLQLLPEGGLDIAVVDGGGQPVAPFTLHVRRRVSAWTSALTALPEPHFASLEYDEHSGGRAWIAPLRRGTYELFASAEGGNGNTLTAAPAVIEVRDGETAPLVVLTLMAARTITGRVLDEDGQALPGARVELLLAESPAHLPGGRTHTDATGRWEITGLPRVPLDVRAHSPGRVPARTAVHSHETGPITLVLVTGGSLAVVVGEDFRGEHAPPYDVVLTRLSDERALLLGDVVSAGRWTDLAPGDYRLSLQLTLEALDENDTPLEADTLAERIVRIAAGAELEVAF